MNKSPMSAADVQLELERIRAERKAGKPRKKKLTPKPERETAVFSNCGPHGERREHPTMLGIHWLTLLGLALEKLEIAANSRVDVSQWETDGCVSIHLQRPIFRTIPAPIVALGTRGHVTTGEEKIMVGAGEWQSSRIPIEAINNHDARWVLRRILGPQHADLVQASSLELRAIQGA